MLQEARLANSLAVFVTNPGIPKVLYFQERALIS